jgi:hypothetical protein
MHNYMKMHADGSIFMLNWHTTSLPKKLIDITLMKTRKLITNREQIKRHSIDNSQKNKLIKIVR